MSTRQSGTPTLLTTLVTAASLLIGVPGTAAGQDVSPDLYQALTYRHIGPEGNRVASVAGIVGDPPTYYAGAASASP